MSSSSSEPDQPSPYLNGSSRRYNSLALPGVPHVTTGALDYSVSGGPSKPRYDSYSAVQRPQRRLISGTYASSPVSPRFAASSSSLASPASPRYVSQSSNLATSTSSLASPRYAGVSSNLAPPSSPRYSQAPINLAPPPKRNVWTNPNNRRSVSTPMASSALTQSTLRPTSTTSDGSSQRAQTYSSGRTYGTAGTSAITRLLFFTPLNQTVLTFVNSCVQPL